MLLKEFVEEAKKRLIDIYGPEEASALVGIICVKVFGLQNWSHLVKPDLNLKKKQLLAAEAVMARLLNGEPIQYILGHVDFYGHRFTVNPSVLIPRPETEILCQQAIDEAMIVFRSRSAYGDDAPPVRILDLCTGSGCIAWTLAAAVPGAKIVALDVSGEAVEVAVNQKIETQGETAPEFICVDIFDDAGMEEILGGLPKFDLLVSNPPYILESEKPSMPRNVLDFEPEIALFVQDEDAQRFNRKIAEIAKKYLHADAFGIVELNEKLGDAAMSVFTDEGLKSPKLVKDLSYKNRFIKFKR